MRFTTIASYISASEVALARSNPVQLEQFAAQGASARTATSERAVPAFPPRNATIVRNISNLFLQYFLIAM
jgi:hypothetical protein